MIIFLDCLGIVGDRALTVTTFPLAQVLALASRHGCHASC
jgi:hypothetical protein